MRFIIPFAGLAAAYCLAGRLALFLAIPPGYATPVWPAAGVALVGILLLGYRFWPAVLVGSFFVNIWTSFDPASTASITRSFATAAGVGLGASLQAVVGAYLVRRFAGFPNPLAGEAEVLKFYLFGGPVSCAINATLGSAVLLSQGVIEWVQYPYNCWTWWVGDTIGILIFAPLFILLTSNVEQGWNRQRKLAVSMPLVLGLVAAVAMFVLASGWETKRLQLEFEQRANAKIENLLRNIADYSSILESLQSFYHSSTHVDRDEFRAFVQLPLSRHAGIQALEWAPLVRADQRPTFEKMARKTGLHNFQILERSATGTRVPAGDRSQYVPIFYIEHMEGNEAALGFDVASDPVRAEALHLARDSGKATATRPVPLVQAKDSGIGLLIYAPVYANGVAHDSVEERRQNLRGYVLAVFRLSDMIGSTLPSEGKEDDINLTVYDESVPGEERLLYGIPTQDPQLPRWSTPVEVAGRQWRADLIVSPAYFAARRSWSAWMVLAGALLFTGLLGALFLMGTGRALHLQQLVAEQTSQLSHANAVLEQEIVGRKRTDEDLRSTYQQVTEKAHRLERFSRQTVGRELQMMELKREVNELLRKLNRPEKYKPVEESGGETALV